MQPISIFDRLHIVDNFYADPDYVRAIALATEKEAECAGNYAGLMTNDAFFTPQHIQQISQLVGHNIESSTSFTGKFRFTTPTDTYKQDIHFDPGNNNCCWAGVIYLSPSVQDTTGTIFWQHKSGMENYQMLWLLEAM